LRRIYKILDRPAWTAAKAAGVFRGSAVDLADGFIHFSGADQAQETARRYFAGQADLVLLTVDADADAFGEAMRWEPSRGGDLFPHLYADLAVADILAERALTLGEDGVPMLGPLDP